MASKMLYHLAFFFLSFTQLAMSIYFQIKVRLIGGQIMPDQKATTREGGKARFSGGMTKSAILSGQTRMPLDVVPDGTHPKNLHPLLQQP